MTATTPAPPVDRRVLRALWGTNRLTGRTFGEVHDRVELDGSYVWAQLQRAWRCGYVRKRRTGAFGGTTYWLTEEGRAHLDAPV